jgi:hypothetical protein
MEPHREHAGLFSFHHHTPTNKAPHNMETCMHQQNPLTHPPPCFSTPLAAWSHTAAMAWGMLALPGLGHSKSVMQPSTVYIRVQKWANQTFYSHHFPRFRQPRKPMILSLSCVYSYQIMCESQSGPWRSCGWAWAVLEALGRSWVLRGPRGRRTLSDKSKRSEIRGDGWVAWHEIVPVGSRVDDTTLVTPLSCNLRVPPPRVV